MGTVMHALNGLRQVIPSRTGGLSAYVKGQGKPLLLIHTINAAASAAEVRTIFDRMSLHRTVYAIDLPGYGASERSDRLYDPRLMTDAVLDLVSHIRSQHGPTAIDALAISIGNLHLQQTAVNGLDLNRPAAIEALTTVPLVIHGGSGVPTDKLAALAAGSRIAKFIIGTELRMEFGSALRYSLTRDLALFDRIAV